MARIPGAVGGKEMLRFVREDGGKERLSKEFVQQEGNGMLFLMH